jgi:hypothetical protein
VAQAERLADVGVGDPVVAGEVRQRARDPQGAVEAAGGEAELVDGGRQRPAGGRRRPAGGAEAGDRQVGVLAALAFPLPRAASTRARTAADGSPVAGPSSSSAATRPTCTYRSMRSSSGPDSRRA